MRSGPRTSINPPHETPCATRRWVVALDLESVLAPEIWVAVAEATGIEHLARTTRDEPDYRVLMDERLQLLAEHDIGLVRLIDVVEQLQPLDGASELLDELRPAALRAAIADCDR